MKFELTYPDKLTLYYPDIPIDYACSIQNAVYDFQATNGNRIGQKKHVETQDINTLGCCVEVDNEFAGGALFYAHNDWIFITYGYVFPKYRGRSLYSRIIECIENWGTEYGYSGLFVSTYEFEAPHIYEHLGFTKGSVLKNIPKGNTSIDYFKNLEVRNETD